MKEIDEVTSCVADERHIKYVKRLTTQYSRHQ
jgi:hypothetical protein